ncbi:hypothetical protein ScPMuIL_010586 [Solemya velum]
MLNPGKKQSLLDWVNALKLKENSYVEQLIQIKDGELFVLMIKLCNANDIPVISDEAKDPLTVVKEYVEGFYHAPLSQYVDLESIIKSDDCDIVEWELSKLLLMLFGAFVQEQNRDVFIKAAMDLPEPMQLEVKELIEGMVTAQAPQNTLSHTFSDILSKEQDSSTHRDAALFFKLVASGLNSTGTVDRSFNYSINAEGNASMLNGFGDIKGSPCPQHVASVVGEIDSPLRMLTLGNSPLTPLGALMQSPQLAQKAFLRQKEQEIKRLELSLQNERHLVGDLEFEIRKNAELLESRELKIRDLEKTVTEQRKLRDSLEEMHVVQSQKDQLESDVLRLQAKLDDIKSLKDHIQILEKENKDMVEEMEKIRDEAKSIDMLKKTCEEYRSTSHKQQLKITELEAILEHRNEEIKQKLDQLQQMDEVNESMRYQRDKLKREKQDIEDQFVEGADTGGECMSVITDKHVSELQAELLQLQNTWIEPSIHNRIVKQLEDASEAKTTYETKYVEMRKDLLNKEDLLEQLQADLEKQKNTTEQLQKEQAEYLRQHELSKSQLEALEETNSKLVLSQSSLNAAKEEADEKLSCLQRDLSHTQAELQMALGEIEAQQTVNESRRLTMAKTFDEVTSEKKKLEDQMTKEQAMWQEKLNEVKDKLRSTKEDASKTEESLKTKLQGVQMSLRQCENSLEQERLVKESLVKSLKSELEQVQYEYNETQTKMGEELKTLKNAQNTLTQQLTAEREQHELKYENLSQDMDRIQNSAKLKEEDLMAKIDTLISEKQSLDLEIHKLKLQTESMDKIWKDKLDKCKKELEDQSRVSGIEITTLQVQKEENNLLQQSLRSELCELTSALQMEREKNCDMKSSLQKQKEEISNLSSKVEHCKLVEDDLTEQVQKWSLANDEETKARHRVMEEKEEIIRNLNKDLEVVHGKLNTVESEGQLKFEELRRKQNELTLKLEEEIELKKTLKEETEKRLCHEISELKNTYEERINCLIDEQKSDLDATQKTCDSRLELLVNEKNEKLKSVSDDFNQLKLDNEKLTSEIEVVKTQNDKLVSDLFEQRKSWDQDQEKLQSLEQAKNSEISQLREDRDQLNFKLKEDSLKFESEFEQLKLQYESSVQAEISKAQASQTQCGLISTELESLKEKSDMDQKNLLALVEDLGKEKTQFESKYNEMLVCVQTRDRDLSQLTEENDKLNSKITEVSSIHKSSIEELKLDYEKLNDAHVAKTQKCELITKELENLKVKYDLDEKANHSAVEVLKKEYHNLELQHKEMLDCAQKDYENKVDSLAQQLSTLEKVKNNTETELQTKLQFLEEALATEQHEKLTLENVVKENCDNFDEVSKNHTEVKLHLQKELGKLRELSSKRENELLEQLKSEQEQLERKHEEMLSTLSENEIIISEKNEELSKLAVELEDKNSAHKELASCLHDKDIEIDELKVHLAEKEAQIQLEVTELSNRVSELNETAAMAKVSKDKLEEEIKNLHSQVIEGNRNIETLNAEKLTFENLLQDKEKLIHELQNTLEQTQVTIEQERQQCSQTTQMFASEVRETENVHKNLVKELEDKLNSQIVQHDEILEKLKADFAAEKSAMKNEHEDQLNMLKGVLGEMTSNISEMKEQQARSENLKSTITDLKDELDKEVGKAKAIQISYEEKIEESEHYWKLQLSQLEEDYHKELQDQKEEYLTQLSDQDMRFESQFQSLLEEKEMQIANQKLGFQDRVAQLENKLSQKQTESENEIANLKDEHQNSLSSMEADYQEKLNHLGQGLQEAAEEQRKMLGEVRDNREKVTLLEKKLDENELELMNQKGHSREMVSQVKEEYQTVIEGLENRLCELKAETECELGEREKEFDQKEVQIRKDLEEELNSMRKDYAEKLEAAEATLATEQQNHMDIVQNLQSKFSEKCLQFESQLAELRSSSQEQKEQYEKDISEIIAEKDAEISTLNSDCENRITEIKEEYELKIHEEIDVKIVEIESSRDGEVKEITVLYELQKKALEEDIRSKQQDIDVLRAQIHSEQEMRGCEKSENVKLKMELADSKHKNDAMYEELQSLVAENTSCRQQLDAVDEERNELEQKVFDLDEKCQHIPSLTEQNKDLATQLNALQQENEIIRSNTATLEGKSAHTQSKHKETEERCTQLQQRVTKLMTREKEFITSHEKDIQKASELNKKLRQQLEEKYKEAAENTRNFNLEIEKFREQAEEMKKMSDLRIQKMDNSQNQREKELQNRIAQLESRFDAMNEHSRQMEEKLKVSDAEKNSLQELTERYKMHYNQKKESIELLEQELSLAKKVSNKQKTKIDKLESELCPMRTKLQEKTNETKALGNQVRTLMSEVDLANEQIRDYRHQLDQAGTVLLGDNTDFLRTVNKADTEESYMETSLDDSLEDTRRSQTPYSLRSRSRNQSCSSSLGGSPIFGGKTDNNLDLEDTFTSSLKPRRSKEFIERQSISTRRSVSASNATQGRWLPQSDLDKSTNSVNSAKSLSSVPRGTGSLFSCEDEPQEFEWGRLSELQRRNTLCLPHLKSSYPVELQTVTKKDFEREAQGSIDLSKTEPRKRKQNMMTVESAPVLELPEASNSKQPRSSAYHRPGPLTPVHRNTRANSGKRTPKTPASGRSRRRDSKKTPHRTPKNDENKGSAKKNARDSISFSIGFTPKKNKRLTRQTAFIQKQPQKGVKVARRPLGNRNVSQTGL